ncbi:hypothetical protein OG896_24010 [Streptomyces sp. NBC_00669]|uniref:hypothetical protein n=1 Tax=unclassified Streptomyces TaxID=2593676 RepID=UPI002E30F915|nr:hypothetical protein [Streptomyces sp. NBC_00669]
MSDTVGSGRTATGASTSAGHPVPPGASAYNVREAYSFACMNCGHGWEQAYEIEHRVDTSGRPYVTYLADGTAVPSPLTRPNCGNCGGHLVRIMRSGQVDEVVSRWHAPRPPHAEPHAHHWSVLGLLRRHGGPGTPAGPAV